MNDFIPADTRTLLATWLRRSREAQAAHYEMANRLGKRGQWFGVPVILITAIVGTSAFASVTATAVSVEAKVAAGLLSVLATVLASLQTFFKFPERAEKHRRSGAQFGAIRRELEATLAEGGTFDPHYVAALREKLDRLADDAPHVPWVVMEAASKSLREDDARRTR